MLQGQHADAQMALEAAAECLKREPGQCLSFSPSDVERETGWVLCHQGRLAEAKGRADRALELALGYEELEGVAGAHNLLARLHYWAGDHSASIESAQAALVIREQMGDVWGAAIMQTNLGVLFHRQGKWAQAESFLRQAIFVQQEIGDRQGVVLSTNNLGLLLVESGRFDEAMDWMNQTVGNLQRQDHPPAVVSQVYGNRGLLWLRMGQPDHAMADLERCRAAAERADNVDLRALSLAYLAEAHLFRHLRAQATELLRQSESLASTNSVPEIVAEIARIRSLVFKDEQDWLAALEANHERRPCIGKSGTAMKRHASRSMLPTSSWHGANRRAIVAWTDPRRPRCWKVWTCCAGWERRPMLPGRRRCWFGRAFMSPLGAHRIPDPGGDQWLR
jgi:Tfp pilus assembly protein PilF